MFFSFDLSIILIPTKFDLSILFTLIYSLLYICFTVHFNHFTAYFIQFLYHFTLNMGNVVSDLVKCHEQKTKYGNNLLKWPWQMALLERNAKDARQASWDLCHEWKPISKHVLRRELHHKTQRMMNPGQNRPNNLHCHFSLPGRSSMTYIFKLQGNQYFKFGSH